MARPRATPIDPEMMTLADLRHALDEKERTLRDLLARKERLADEIEELGETLQAMLTGSDVAASRRSKAAPDADGSPARNEPPTARASATRKRRVSSVVREGSLQTAIRSVLERVIGPLKVAEIVDAVLKSGYATKSANLNVIVCNRLAQMLDVEKVDRGLYQLKRTSAPAEGAETPAPEAAPMARAATA